VCGVLLGRVALSGSDITLCRQSVSLGQGDITFRRGSIGHIQCDIALRLQNIFF
jgi:hypothetical protein